MNKIVESLLHEEKTRIQEVTAPENMEARLRTALSTAAPKRIAFRKKGMGGLKIAAAVLAVMLLVAGNQYRALAYYGKTLLGFDRVADGTLDKLNQEGWGQELGEQVKLADGSMLTLDGLMSDENQFILYYTLSHPDGLVQEDAKSRFLPTGIKGFRTEAKSQSETWGPGRDRTEIKGIITFDPVSPLAKKLTLTYWEDTANGDQRQEGHVTFPFHPDEAMPTMIKQSIQTVAAQGSSIIFGSITATPTMTVVEGTLPEENRKLFGQINHGVELVANGDRVTLHRSDIHINESKNGYTFTLRYDPLPEKLHSVQLVLKENGETIEIPLK
ncbi:DUF4179 domain-containing protein [Paenibacillus nanensis]|uniref:DUF4179 domain-containing protein n=1 Tax=Paenibacillus nanensis TaxID=393251 RepID=A0A3A1UYM2_9BACL|nr:DUF4179 domain-containing protein [Paenibacillus nanensis]RIX52796.1 DUF4179 domain-containing protein [Paenibacillus nanensis]